MTALFYRLYYPCDKIRDFAYDYLDGKLSAVVSIRFHLHLRGCPGCQQYMLLYRQAADGGRFREENPPPREMLDETLAFLEKHGIVPPGGGDVEGGGGEPGDRPGKESR